MRVPHFLLVVAVAQISQTISLELSERNVALEEIQFQDEVPLNTEMCFGEKCLHHRQRRFLASIVKLAKVAWGGAKVLMQVGNTGLQITSLSLFIANEATGGCAVYPGICQNQKIIQTLEQECIDLSARLMEKYEHFSNDYNILREVVLNNIALENKIDQITEEMTKIFDLSIELDSIFVGNMLNTSNINYLPIEEIELMLNKSMDFRLTHLTKSVLESSRQTVKELEHFLSTFLQVKSTHYNVRKTSPYFKYAAKLKGIKPPEILKGLHFNSFFSKAKNFINNFKTVVQSTFHKQLSTLKSKLMDPKGTVKSYVNGINAARTFVNSVGVAIKSISFYLNHRRWKNIEMALEKDVHNFREQKSSLQDQLSLASIQTDNVTTIKNEAIDYFNNILSNFASIINHSSKSEEKFNNLFISPANIAILVQNQQTTPENVLEHQNTILNIFREVIYQLRKYQTLLQNLKLITELTSIGIKTESSVGDIFQNIKTASRYSENTGQFSPTDLLETLLCVLSMIKRLESNYKTYHLSSLREKCSQSPTDLFTTEYINNHRQMALNWIVQNEVLKQLAARSENNNMCMFGWYPPQCVGSIQVIDDSIRTFFSKDPLLKSFPNPTYIDILKRIALLFPTERTFAFLDLSYFAPDSNLSHNQFLNLFFDAEEEKENCEHQARNDARNLC